MKQAVALLLFCIALLQGPYSGAQGVKSGRKDTAVDTAFLLPVNGVKQYLEIKGVKLLGSYLDGEKTNLLKQNTFQLPVYLIVGKYDYTTSAELAKQYFAVMKAPKKQLFLFEHSGHTPNWKEPVLFHTRLVQLAAANQTN